MNNVYRFCAFFVGSYLISSCHKMEMNMLNINFPAVYVVNGQDNNIDVINLNDHTHSNHISLNGATFPHHIYINPSKTKLAVAITSTNLSGGHASHGGATSGFKIQIIDATTGMIDKEITLPKMPHNAIFSADGSELWISQYDTLQSQILVYKSSDWSLQNIILIGKGVSEVTFSNNGNLAFACNTLDGTVSVINQQTKAIQTTISVGQDPIGAWAASNGKMYVDNEMSQSISEIDINTLTVTQTIPLGFKPAYAAYLSNTNELWVSDATNGKVICYTSSNNIWTRNTEIITGADAHAIVVNSTQTKAYVTNQGANTLSVIEIANKSISATIAVGLKPNGLALK